MADTIAGEELLSMHPDLLIGHQMLKYTQIVAFQFLCHQMYAFLSLCRLKCRFFINICIAFNYLKRGPEIEAAYLPMQAVLPMGCLFTQTNYKGDDISIQYVQPP